MVSIPTCNCCRINIAFPHSKIARGESEKAQAGYVYTDRPAQSNFVAIAFAGLPRPQSNLNIIPVFAVPMLPGICVLKFKMKFYMWEPFYTHFVLISCHYWLSWTWLKSFLFFFATILRNFTVCFLVSCGCVLAGNTKYTFPHGGGVASFVSPKYLRAFNWLRMDTTLELLPILMYVVMPLIFCLS